MNRGRSALLLIAAAAAVGIAYAFGADLVHSLLVAAAAALLVALGFLTHVGREAGWPEDPRAGGDHGARREVSRLSWTLIRQDGRVHSRSTGRLQALARRRLAERSLDLVADADACRALLGDVAYAVLTADAADHPPSYPAFVAAVAAVERLADSSPAGLRA